MAQDPYKYFRLEARELLDHLGKGALDLERTTGLEAVPRLLRHAHTLKGAARVVRQREIADRAHAIEDALAPHREGREPIAPATITSLLALIDEISRLLARLDEPAHKVASPAVSDDTPRSVRADLAEMDALLDGIMEAHARIAPIRGAAKTIEDARQRAELLVDQLARMGASEADRRMLGRARSIADQLRDLVSTVAHGLRSDVEALHRELVQVRDRGEQLRLVPAASLFVSLERTVRDAAESLGKQVAFHSKGGDVRLDAHVLGAIQGALVQLARNAVAHGIEATPRRIAAGKSPVGQVTIEITRRGRRVAFCCRDDGGGVDVDAVRRLAGRAGLAPSQTAPLGVEELLRLLLRGGITTSATITEVSGRGIGLDVVRDVAERLGGTVSVETGTSGTTFELVVPASLASLEALGAEMAGVRALVPLQAVRRTARVGEHEISRTAHASSIVHEGNVIPFVPLAEILRSHARTRVGGAWSTVIVEGADGLAAVGVDRLIDTATVVVRLLPELAAADAIVAGAALDPTGHPVLVLDPDGVIAAARRDRTSTRTSTPTRHSVLVIDDSLTTRMLEQSILESAGFEVDTAVSGELGLEAARRKRYALFLVDVEMPGIDGFTFIERIRSDADLRDTPAILVTSRSSVADRQRGEQVGAQGYIVKSEFDQTDLVARIHRLVS
jgi:two-component system, chemotaxis family, sensor kinase CheA